MTKKLKLALLIMANLFTLGLTTIILGGLYYLFAHSVDKTDQRRTEDALFITTANLNLVQIQLASMLLQHDTSSARVSEKDLLTIYNQCKSIVHGTGIRPPVFSSFPEQYARTLASVANLCANIGRTATSRPLTYADVSEMHKILSAVTKDFEQSQEKTMTAQTSYATAAIKSMTSWAK